MVRERKKFWSLSQMLLKKTKNILLIMSVRYNSPWILIFKVIKLKNGYPLTHQEMGEDGHVLEQAHWRWLLRGAGSRGPWEALPEGGPGGGGPSSGGLRRAKWQERPGRVEAAGLLSSAHCCCLRLLARAWAYSLRARSSAFLMTLDIGGQG